MSSHLPTSTDDLAAATAAINSHLLNCARERTHMSTGDRQAVMHLAHAVTELTALVTRAAQKGLL